MVILSLFAGTTLQFEFLFYHMLEGEVKSICIVSKADIQRPVQVDVIPSSSGKSFMAGVFRENIAI